MPVEQPDPTWLPEALELRKAGFSYGQIAKRFDVTKSRAVHYVDRAAPRPVFRRVCPQCDTPFHPQGESKNYSQRYCSRPCAKAGVAARRREHWPSEAEMRRLVEERGLSDSKIGAKYGHTYEWARQVRNFYGIKAVPKPPHREIKHGRYIGRAKWSCREKGETRCRACGRRPAGDGSVLGSLHLHHAIPRSMCKATSLDLRNGVPLCYDCHSGWHDRRVTLYRDIFTEGEWAFLSTVELLGQMVGPWLDTHYPDRGRPPCASV